MVYAILPATDMERAKRFYREKLGLNPVDLDAENVLIEGAGGSRLMLYKRSSPTKADHTVAGFEVQNVEEMVQQLQDQGVSFEKYDLPGLKTDEHGIAEIEGKQVAFFKDSEGNILAIGPLAEETGQPETSMSGRASGSR
jgi:catechol 2,3-dioxygenase-like lactoylglutathione lyase family enzyme